MGSRDVLFRKILVDLMRKYRTEHGYNQEVMAEKLHISPRAYMAQEHGDYGFSAATVINFLLLFPEEERSPLIESIRDQMQWPLVPPDDTAKRSRREIGEILLYLGATPHYKGYQYTEYALSLIRKDEQYLHAIGKWLYPEIASHFQTSEKAVERNIRTIARVSWESNRKRLESIARHSLPARPTASEFLSILAIWIQTPGT